MNAEKHGSSRIDIMFICFIFALLIFISNMRKLVVDFGNTLQKLAAFENGEMLREIVFSKVSASDILKFAEQNGPFESCILSTVIDYPGKIREVIQRQTHFMELTGSTPLPVKNLYLTPETLGKDRLAAVVGASAIYPGKNLLVIDAGTCITYDLVTSGREYLGGSISPGISMRFRALNAFTDRLPLIEPKPFNSLIGRNTEESILSGVLNGVEQEIIGIISLYEEQFENLSVVITGGDHKILLNKLKNNIFAVPNLVLKGLNEILAYNEKGL
jgi:type III pantothenate kinase